MARDMGITPGTEDWCGIWLCSLLSRSSRLPSPLFDNRSQKGRAGTEILAPKVTCRLLGGERFVERRRREARMASPQPRDAGATQKRRTGALGWADNSEC